MRVSLLIPFPHSNFILISSFQRAFPKCPFGIKCHYIHPSCRYDGHCTRFDCPYTHLIKTSPLITPAAAAAVLALPTPQNYFKQKSSKNRKFMLNRQAIVVGGGGGSETECKFGAACKNLNCLFAHPKLPTKSALKWNCGQQQIITNSN